MTKPIRTSGPLFISALAMLLYATGCAAPHTGPWPQKRTRMAPRDIVSNAVPGEYHRIMKLVAEAVAAEKDSPIKNYDGAVEVQVVLAAARACSHVFDAVSHRLIRRPVRRDVESARAGVRRIGDENPQNQSHNQRRTDSHHAPLSRNSHLRSPH